MAAYSPGFLIDVTPRGKPPILISHGNQDAILSFEHTSQQIVPRLSEQGYQVDFRQFTGGHAISIATMEDFVRSLSAPAVP